MIGHTLAMHLLFVAACAGAMDDLVLHNVNAAKVNYEGRDAIRVVESAKSTEEDKLVLLAATDFTNGTISGYVAGNVRQDAGPQARGFVGIAFRVAEDLSSFEAVYLRPANARAQDQLRRNHSIQYISFPEYPWHRLRRETPGRYESYADMVPGEWIHYRLEVIDAVARLYLNHSDQPALIVNDLKLGKRAGRVGLWIGPGTEAHFSGVAVERH